MKYIQGQYCFFLNSEDMHDPDIALTKNTTSGGTLLLWNKQIDPYVTIHPVQTTSFTPLVLKMPGVRTTVHFAL